MQDNMKVKVIEDCPVGRPGACTITALYRLVREGVYGQPQFRWEFEGGTAMNIYQGSEVRLEEIGASRCAGFARLMKSTEVDGEYRSEYQGIGAVTVDGQDARELFPSEYNA